MGWRSLGARSAGTASTGLAIPRLEPAAAGAPTLGPHARGCPRRSVVPRGSATRAPRASVRVSLRGTGPRRTRPAASTRPRLPLPAPRARALRGDPARPGPSPGRSTDASSAGPNRRLPDAARCPSGQCRLRADTAPPAPACKGGGSHGQPHARGTGRAPGEEAAGTGGARRAAGLPRRDGTAARVWRHR